MNGSKQDLDGAAKDRDSSQILEQGVRALAVLSKQVELIAAETRRAELEDALAKAREGQTKPLRQWLSTNAQCVAFDPAETESYSEAEDLLKRCDDSPVPSQGRPAAIADTAPPDQSGAALRQQSPNRLVEHTVPAQAVVPVSPKKPTDKLAPRDEKPAAKPIKKPTGVIQGLNLAEVNAQTATGSSQREKRKLGWQVRGMLVSTLLHLLLIAYLTFVTIAGPQLGGILQFEASDSSESGVDSFELVSDVHEIDVETPSEQVDVTSSDFQPILDAALPAIGDYAVQSSLSETTVSSVSSNAMSQALKASSGRTGMGGSRSPMNLGAQFFGASASGGFFCFLIDGSPSMKGGAWDAAHAELIRSLSSLSEKQRFYIMFYNKDELNRVLDPETGKPARTGLYATKANLQAAANWLNTLEIGPGGGQSKVLEAALELEPDAIFYLTDGEMTSGVEDYIFKMLRTNNRVSDIVEGELVRIPINAIAYYSEKGMSFMQQIAAENRGQFKYVPKPVAEKSKSRKR